MNIEAEEDEAYNNSEAYISWVTFHTSNTSLTCKKCLLNPEYRARPGHSPTPLHGNRISLTDPENNKTSWKYDSFGRVEEETNQLGKTLAYEYDALGNVKLVTKRDGTKIESGYDSLSRKTSEKWLTGTGTVASSLSFSYNVGGDLLSASDADSSNTFLYTPRGLLKSDVQQLTSTITATIDNTSYDALGRRTQFQVKVGNVVDSTVDYGYANNGIDTTIKQSGTNVASKSVKYTRDSAGRLTQLKRYADLTNTEPVAWTDFAIDQVNSVAVDRTKSITHRFGTTVLDQFNLTWDPANRLRSVDSLQDGNSTFQYDLVDQLVLRAELWSHFWPNCDCRDLGLFFGVLAELN